MSNYCDCHLGGTCEWCRITEQNERYRESIRYAYEELQALYSRMSILGAENEKPLHLKTIEYVGLEILRKAWEGDLYEDN